ncbi:MAG: hypothetical protein LR011_13925, partial [Verrucomicrobia bacterium]|nr:hypothetical protein [Verrucomicrobiota bacterium]
MAQKWSPGCPRLLQWMIYCTTTLATMVASMGDENWPTWRGPGSNGVAPDSNPPVEWSEEQNIRWKTPIPGEGHSSPIVWGDRIFLMTAVTQSDSPSSESSASPIEPISPPTPTRTWWTWWTWWT